MSSSGEQSLSIPAGGDPVDIICVGFGPAALACAIAFVDKRDQLISEGKTPAFSTIRFIEKHEKFEWHPGMLLPGSSMQISFLKDLATLRKPTSSYTFLSYLHEHERLVTYINRGSFIPSRREFSDYLTWAAAKVSREKGVTVHYSEEVVNVTSDGSTVSIVSRTVPSDQPRGDSPPLSPNGSDDTRLHTRTGRHLIIAPGGSTRLPPSLTPIVPSPQIIHTSAYLQQIDRIFASIAPSDGTPLARPLRIAVIGSGQSAAECLLNLYSRLHSVPLAHKPVGVDGLHQVDLIIRRGSLKPSDDSPFANEIFDPASTDFMFNLPSKDERSEVRREYESTNYGVVNPKTIDVIYEKVYDQKIEDGALARGAHSESLSRPRLNILTYRAIVSASTAVQESSNAPEKFNLTLHHVLGAAPDEERTYDAIILGTGYERHSWLKLLNEDDFGGVFGFGSRFARESASARSASKPRVPVVSENCPPQPLEINSKLSLPVSPPLTTAPSSTHSHSLVNSTAPSSPSSRSDSPVPSSPSSLPGAEHGEEEEEEEDEVPTPLQQLKINRAYRLLPVDQSRRSHRENSRSPARALDFKPRVYIQGIAEETHGLSDTLLSILSVRGGEVIDDLFAAAV